MVLGKIQAIGFLFFIETHWKWCRGGQKNSCGAGGNHSDLGAGRAGASRQQIRALAAGRLASPYSMRCELPSKRCATRSFARIGSRYRHSLPTFKVCKSRRCGNLYMPTGEASRRIRRPRDELAYLRSAAFFNWCGGARPRYHQS